MPLSEIIEDDPDDERPSFRRQDKQKLRYPLPKQRTCDDCWNGRHGACSEAGREWCLCEQADHDPPFPP